MQQILIRIYGLTVKWIRWKILSVFIIGIYRFSLILSPLIGKPTRLTNQNGSFSVVKVIRGDAYSPSRDRPIRSLSIQFLVQPAACCALAVIEIMHSVHLFHPSFRDIQKYNVTTNGWKLLFFIYFSIFSLNFTRYCHLLKPLYTFYEVLYVFVMWRLLIDLTL